jgi:ferredoxin-type protein NapH
MKKRKETQPGSPPGRFLPTGVLRHLNKVRHGVQVGVVLFVLAIPVLSLYQSYAASHAIQWMEGGEQLFFGNLDRIAFWFSDDPVEALDAVKGSVWSAQIGGLKISDPLAVAGQTVAEKRIYWPFVLSMLIPVLVTLALGRVFCGWVCPAYLLYEVGDVIRQLLNRAGIRPRNIQLPLVTKYVVLGIGIAGGWLLGVALFPMIYPPAVIGREVYYGVYNGVFGSGAVLLAISLFIEIGISRRAVCRYLCPGGALYSLLGAARVVRLRRDADACTPCVKCDDVCGLGLNPMTDRTGMECNNCTACIAVCPCGALTLAIGWSSGNFSGGAGTGTETGAETGTRANAGRRGGSSSSQGTHDSHLPDRAAYTA